MQHLGQNKMAKNKTPNNPPEIKLSTIVTKNNLYKCLVDIKNA